MPTTASPPSAQPIADRVEAVHTVSPLPFAPSVEQLEADEAQTAVDLTDTLASISDQTFKDSGQALRSVHAKSHGLLHGELQVLPVPDTYAQGFLAQPKIYPVLIRLSTSPGDVLDDKVSTPRGMAIKILGVSGERLPGQPESSSQDLLMVNAPAFVAPTGKRFLANMKLLAATTDRIARLKLAFAAMARAGERALEAMGTESASLITLGGHPLTHPLGETYFSQTPFLHGPYMAKWSCAPVAPELKALTDRSIDLADRPNGLREEVNAYFEQFGAEWELRVQLCTDLEKMPIEDASIEWPESLSPYVAVARIRVDPQTAWSEDRRVKFDEGLSFSPWHGLAAHRPLGSINRMRRLAYPNSAARRSPRGVCPVHDPSAIGDGR